MALIEGGEHWKGKPQGYAGLKKEGAPASGAGGGGAGATTVEDAADSWARGTAGPSTARVLRSGLSETMPKTYRGIELSNPSFAKLQARYSPGVTVDMDLSSFSASRGVAQKFSTHYGIAHSIMFTLGGGGKGMNLSAKLSHDQRNEQEWVTGGRFRVTSFRSHGNTHEVYLAQVAVVGP